MATPFISIILPVYNRVEHLRVCLDCLKSQTLPQTNWEVVLISDGGPLEIDSLASEFGAFIPLQFMKQPNSGPAVARNAAMAEATGEHFLFLNDDIRFAPDYLQAVAEFLKQYPRYAMIGNTRMAPEIMAHDIQHWHAHQDDHFYHIANPLIGSWDFWHTLNASLPRHWFEEGHLFDESFPDPAFEDTEFIYRLEKHHQIPTAFNARAIVEHVHPYTFESLLSKQFMRGKSAARFVELYPEKYQRIYGVENDGGAQYKAAIAAGERLIYPQSVDEMATKIHSEFLKGAASWKGQRG
ncbi:MAG: glycosyltransferase family 2 protein [Sumerlaeia bacterium]